MINELTAQRSLINESIKNLVLSNLVKVINTKSGFIYKIHDLGINLSNEMSTDYAIRYKKTARNVMNFAQNMSIREVKRFARNKEEENYNVIY
jgi:hypothetical protein